MPNFKKIESQLENRLDKWLYFIKHLEDLQNIPEILSDKVFEKAEISNLRKPALDKYEASFKVFRDNKAVYDYAVTTAFDEGKIEEMNKGELEKAIKVAKQAKEMRLPKTDIAKLTGLSEEEISKI